MKRLLKVWSCLNFKEFFMVIYYHVTDLTQANF